MKALRRSHTSSASSSSTTSCPSASSASSSWAHLRSLLVVASSPPVQDRLCEFEVAELVLTHRAYLKSPWSRRRRKCGLTRQQWNALFSPDGKLQDEVKFLNKVRSGGIEPRLRAEVWPFLLGVYSLNSSEADRSAVEMQKREEFVKLRHLCERLSGHSVEAYKEIRKMDSDSDGEGDAFTEVPYSPIFDYISSSRQSLSIEGAHPGVTGMDRHSSQSILIGGGSPEDASSDQSISQPIISKGEKPGRSVMSFANYAFRGEDKSDITHAETSTVDTDPSVTDSSVEGPDCMHNYSETAVSDMVDHRANMDPLKWDSFRSFTSHPTAEDYVTWQRIIRLDALRAKMLSGFLTLHHKLRFLRIRRAIFADSVRLKGYEHMEEAYRIYHAARLVAILEAYSIYDSEIGYCQGMSDLLSPIVAVMEDDCGAFWCFVGFMRKARHNFRLDEVGIKRQLGMVSKIIRYKDAHLYRHLEKLQAEDCFFVYRMVVVMLRRELSFEQTVCLWEVMWADQAAIQAGIWKSSWGRRRLQAPPTVDLLLYAACVLCRRKLITENYSSMDEILRECNSLAGHLDVWRLLDDAHALVVTLHDKL